MAAAKGHAKLHQCVHWFIHFQLSAQPGVHHEIIQPGNTGSFNQSFIEKKRIISFKGKLQTLAQAQRRHHKLKQATASHRQATGRQQMW